MDPVLSQLLLGVVSNALSAMLLSPFDAVSDRGTVVMEAVQAAVEDLIEVPAIDPDLGGERLRGFLQSNEVAAIARQVFSAEVTGRSDLLAESRDLFQRLHESYVGVAIDGDASGRLFDALVSSAGTAIAVGTDSGLLPAHDALEAFRHNLVMDSIAGVSRLLELDLDRGMATREEVDEFATSLRAQTVERLGSITPPSFDSVRRVPIDDLYVESQLEVEENDQTLSWTLTDLAQRLHRTVVLGNPGGGKSTLARKICHDIARDRLRGRLFGPGTVPVLVVLRDFGAAKVERAISIRDFVEERAHADYQLDVPRGAMEYLLRAGRVLLVFDGLDELLDTSYRSEITADIQSLASLYTGVPILVTSRRIGYPEAPLDPRVFKTAALGDLRLDQVTEYATKWFSLDPAPDHRPASSEAAEFIDDSQSVGDLRANPLMLALMCNLYREGPGYIPRNRPEVYEKCAVMLFERWDRGRRIHAKLEFERHLRPALQYLAYWMYSDPTLQSGVLERDLVNKVAVFLQQKRFPDEDEARAEAARFVQFCRGRAWVFADAGTTPAGESLYEFTHRTFLEFFTAEHLVRTSRTPEILASTLLPRIERAEWDIVAQLAFQLQDTNIDDASDELLGRLLDAANATDGAHERERLLEFAVRSLGFLVPAPPTLRRITETVCNAAIDDLERFADDATQVPAATAYGGLTAVHWENRDVVAKAIRSTLREALAAGTSIKTVSDLGFHLSLAPNIGFVKDAMKFWDREAGALAAEIEPALRAAAMADAEIAASAVYLNRLNVSDIPVAFVPHVCFRARNAPRLFPGRSWSGTAERALYASAGDGVSSGLRVDTTDSLRRDLADIGRLLLKTRPPWFSTEGIHVGVANLLGRRGTDILGAISGDVAFGVFAALGVRLEVASHSGELEDMLEVLIDGGLEWQRQLAPIASARYGRDAPAIDDALARLALPKRALELSRAWCAGERARHVATVESLTTHT